MNNHTARDWLGSWTEVDGDQAADQKPVEVVIETFTMEALCPGGGGPTPVTTRPGTCGRQHRHRRQTNPQNHQQSHLQNGPQSP